MTGAALTVLSEYDRLEASGLWRAGADAQRRDVVVSVGEATLILYDMSESALAHWSLPAVERLNPGETPALYAPGADAPDRLEIDDSDMIEAIERVRTAILKSRGQPGRLRLTIAGGVLAIAVVLAVFWLPGASARYAASILPDAARSSMGDDMMGHIRRLTGPPCAAPAGTRALFALERRLFPDGLTRLRVVPSGLAETAHLPGGMILLGHAIAEDFETPEVVAGFILAEAERRRARDPAERLLTDAGLGATLTLLTTGRVPPEALKAHAEAQLTAPAPPLVQDDLIAAFRDAGISPAPYAFARDISGETTLPLVEGAALAPGDSAPLLTDGQWIALQQICES